MTRLGLHRVRLTERPLVAGCVRPTRALVSIQFTSAAVCYFAVAVHGWLIPIRECTMSAVVLCVFHFLLVGCCIAVAVRYALAALVLPRP